MRALTFQESWRGKCLTAQASMLSFVAQSTFRPQGAPPPMSATQLTQIPSAVYAVDPAHSSVGFEVKHMGIATVRGRFGTFAGTIDATGDAPVLEGTVDVATIETGDANRDGHLKGPEFFDADQQPKISFHSTATEVGGAGQITLQGRDHHQGDHQAHRAHRRDRRERSGPVGQRAHRPRAQHHDRPARLRPEVEPDPPQRQPPGRQRGQAGPGRVRRQERLVR